MSGRGPAFGEDRWVTAVQRGLAVLWGAFIPALLTGVVVKYLVPRTGKGAAGLVAALGHHEPYFGAALFVLFAALGRYWRFLLPRAAFEPIAAPAPPSQRRREAFALVATVVAAGIGVLAFRALVAQPYVVVSSSMLPTLAPDDDVVGSKLALGRPPHRGDLIVFRTASVPHFPNAGAVPDVLVKRVVGLPGDRIAMRNGAPVINGWPIPTCDVGEYAYPVVDGKSGEAHAIRGRLAVEFLEDRAYLTIQSSAFFSDEYTVQAGDVFVLGDNRGNSLDSRAYNDGHGGGVPLGAIQATVKWFLVGLHRGGGIDIGRMFRPVDAVQKHLRLEGLDTQELDAAIERCLQKRPTDTRPPAAERASLDTSADR